MTTFERSSLVEARAGLSKVGPVSMPCLAALALGLASKIPPSIVFQLQATGECTRTRCVDLLRSVSGYVITGATPSYRHDDTIQRAFDAGNAFVWGLKGAIVNPHLNPYIGHRGFMKRLHAGSFDLNEAQNLESKFRRDGYINPLGSSEAERLGYINLVQKAT